MKSISDFSVALVPFHTISYAVTSEPDYEMDRTIVCEDWPEYGDVTVIHGSHCSCYGFDDTSWDAMIYTEDEFKKLIALWHEDGYGSEKPIANAWFETHGGKP